MTQRSGNHLGRRHEGQPASEPPASPLGCTDEAEELDKLLNRVRHHAALLLAELAHPPRAVRVRAGEVSLELEWAPGPGGAASGTGTVPGPGTEPVVAPPVAPVEADPDVHYLISPAVGVFYRAPGPGAAPFVSEGEAVVAGQQVGIIEAMKLMIPIEAERAGRVLQVLKNDAEPVEYGERLFALAVVGAAGGVEQPCSARC
jgi:acetyl-CoA carboxylase biotin carboxyl carrier protein